MYQLMNVYLLTYKYIVLINNKLHKFLEKLAHINCMS